MPFFNPRAYLDRPTLRTTRGIIQQQRAAAQRTEQERKNLLEEQEADAESFDELVRQDRARLYQLGGQLQRQEMQERGELAQEAVRQRGYQRRQRIREAAQTRRQLATQQVRQRGQRRRQAVEQYANRLKAREQQQGELRRKVSLFQDISRDQDIDDRARRTMLSRLTSGNWQAIDRNLQNQQNIRQTLNSFRGGEDYEQIRDWYLSLKKQQTQAAQPPDQSEIYERMDTLSGIIKRIDQNITTIQREKMVREEPDPRLAKLKQRRKQYVAEMQRLQNQLGPNQGGQRQPTRPPETRTRTPTGQKEIVGQGTPGQTTPPSPTSSEEYIRASLRDVGKTADYVDQQHPEITDRTSDEFIDLVEQKLRDQGLTMGRNL